MNSNNFPLFTKAKVLSLIDLTSLNDTDTASSIIDFTKNATTQLGTVAAVCIYGQFIPFVKSLLPNGVKLATVVNFPTGEAELDAVINETIGVINFGATEVDLVIPYQDYINHGTSENACKMLQECKKICGDKTLKVIIESGELKSKNLIAIATRDAIESGADFVKTSTGKTPNGASLEAAEVMLKEIKKHKEKTAKTVGFKASGGIKTYTQAVKYLNLAVSILGENFINPQTFRFGASSLLNDLLQ